MLVSGRQVRKYFCTQGAAWHNRVRRGTTRVRHGTTQGAAWHNSGCGVAQLGCGVAQLGCGVAQLGCGVAQLVARRLAVRQARVRISARHPRGGPLLSGSDEDNKKRFSTSYIYKYCMYACLMINNK
jgi:hypothetical protein